MSGYDFISAANREWSASTPRTDLSIVVPVFNEEACVPLLIDRLTTALEPLSLDYEIVLVDDGSSDGTWDAIQAARTADGRVEGLRLVRNFGHQSALLAGLYYAAGSAVVTMDGDLQHPPETVPDMVARWREGYRVINTRREDSETAGTLKRAGSRNFYRVFSWLANVTMSEGSSDFRLLDREIVERLLQFRGGHDFLRGAVNWFGYPAATVTFQAAERHAGRSKYNFSRMVRFASDAVVSFSTKPLHLGIWLGLGLSALSFVELAYTLAVWLSGATVAGWASIMIVMTFLFGFMFLLIGILGAYLSRIHRALQAPPRFIVAEGSSVGRGPALAPRVNLDSVP